jgi:DNA-binding GntR family transcriptional regulator
VPTAATRVYDELRTAILGGSFEEGSHLSETRLAESLGCSRTPVREALRRLSAEGLVEFLPNRGAQVVSWPSADLADVFRIRALLEGHGAYLSAREMSEEGIEQLEAMADRMDELVEDGGHEARDGLARLDVLFHRTVLAGGNSQRLLQAHARVVQVPLHQRVMRLYDEPQLRQRMAHHRELATAIRAGDPEWAKAVMTTHILSALNILLHDE